VDDADWGALLEALDGRDVMVEARARELAPLGVGIG